MFLKTERGGFAGLGADKTYNIYRYEDLAEYFDECFGLGGKGVRGFMNSVKKNKQDIMAAAAITQSVKSMLAGGDQEQAAQVITDNAKLVLQGDRTEWIQKTDAVLSSAKIAWKV